MLRGGRSLLPELHALPTPEKFKSSEDSQARRRKETDPLRVAQVESSRNPERFLATVETNEAAKSLCEGL